MIDDPEMDQPPLAEGNSSDAISVLLAEYGELSEADRGTGSVFTALASVAVALVAAIIGFLSQSCAAGGSVECTSPVSMWVYILIPLPALVVATYGVQVGAQSSMRSYYLRLIERELQRRLRMAVEIDGELVPLPSYSHISMALNSTRHGLSAFRGLWALVNLGLMVLLFGASALALAEVQPVALRALAAGIYIGLLLYVARAAALALANGHSAWLQALDALPYHLGRSLGRRTDSGHRTLLSYLVMPRPMELIKALLTPAGFGLGAWFLGDPYPLQDAFWFWIVFEFVTYHGRYMLNDLRDQELDQLSPTKGHRRRMPPTPRAPLATLLVMTLRGMVTLLVLTLWDNEVRVGLGWWAAAVAVSTVIYEWIRDRTRSLYLASWPASALRRGEHAWLWALYAEVGVGYGLRVTAGVWLGSGGTASAGLLALTAATVWAMGTMWVTMTWALEATSYVGQPSDESSLAETRPSGWTLTRGIAKKSHLCHLLEFCAAGRDKGDYVDKTTKILAPPGRWGTPWDCALVVSASGAGVLGLALQAGGSPGGLGATALAAVVGGATGVALARWSLKRSMGSTLGGVALLWIVAWQAGLQSPFVGLPLFVVGTSYAGFRGSNFATLETTPKQAVGQLIGQLDALAKGLARRDPDSAARRPGAMQGPDPVSGDLVAMAED